MSVTGVQTCALPICEVWQATLAYYNSIKQAAKMGVPDAKAIYEDLRPRFEAQRAKPITPITWFVYQSNTKKVERDTFYIERDTFYIGFDLFSIDRGIKNIERDSKNIGFDLFNIAFDTFSIAPDSFCINRDSISTAVNLFWIAFDSKTIAQH